MTANKPPKALRKAWFLFAVFLLPAILCLIFYYFFVRKPLIIDAKPSTYKAMPYFGSKTISDKGDTVYNTIKPINLINLDGKPFNLSSTEGKVLIVNFFTLQNIDKSNKMAASLFRVQNKLEYLKKLAVISINLTPEKDSIKNLIETSKNVHTHPRFWNFYTGNQAEVERWARVNFGLRKSEIDSLSYSQFYLIDLNRNIRGTYDGTQSTEVNRLLDEVKVLNSIYRIK